MKDRSVNKSKVLKEYGMTPCSIARDVEAIKQWLVKQPHLPKINPELLSIQVDDWLENYLILCKNSMEKVKDGIDMYFTSKILLPELYLARDPLTPSFEKSFDIMSISLTPGLTEKGRKVLIFSHTKPSGEDFDPVVMIKRVSMMLDILLLEGVDYSGCEVIIDCKNVCFAQLARYNLAFTKKAMEIGSKALPQRIFKIHLVNPPASIETFLSFFKPILKKKLSERFVIHHDNTELIANLGVKMTPCDLGGENESIESQNRYWQKKLIEYRSWFETTHSLRSDESKRIGKCRYESPDAAFGNQGSFRKIEVD